MVLGEYTKMKAAIKAAADISSIAAVEEYAKMQGGAKNAKLRKLAKAKFSDLPGSWAKKPKQVARYELSQAVNAKDLAALESALAKEEEAGVNQAGGLMRAANELKTELETPAEEAAEELAQIEARMLAAGRPGSDGRGRRRLKRRRQQLKEQWRNFFDIPQYALKGYGESLPATVANQDAFVTGETVPQLGKVFVMCHGCAATIPDKGNQCSEYLKEKVFVPLD